MKIETIELTESVKTFLESYRPESDLFTSIKEIRLVEDNLNIESHKEGLKPLRNSVVKFYADLMNEEVVNDEAGDIYLKNPDRFFALNNAMMSVTAVIDNYAYKF